MAYIAQSLIGDLERITVASPTLPTIKYSMRIKCFRLYETKLFMFIEYLR